MISREYLKSIGLSDEQVELVDAALDKENRYRQILAQEGILPQAVEGVLRVTNLDQVDFHNDLLMREKIREEWRDLIVKNEQRRG